jgi:hypothetical protein
MTREELIKRLEAGEEGREIDKEMARNLGWTDNRQFIGWGHGWEHWYKDKDGETQYEIPKWSTSLDAAVALCERVLPEHSWCSYKHGYAQITLRGLKGHGGNFDAVAPTPAAALLAALLKATLGDGP